MKKILIVTGKVMVASGLLVYLFTKIDWGLFLVDLKNANLLIILSAALISFLSTYISVLRWDVFLSNYGLKIRKIKLYSLYSISSFLNNFLPTTIGGDIYKLVDLNKCFPEKKKEILSSVILERGSGFVVIFLLNVALIPFFYKLIFDNRAFLSLEIIIVFCLLFLLFFIKHNQIFFKMKKIIKKDILLIDKFCRLITSLTDIKSKKSLWLGIFYSVIYAFLCSTVSWLQFYSFGVEINFFHIVLINTITLIIGVIPLSLNSLGVTEGLNVFLFSLAGVPMEVSLAVSLIGRVSLMLTSSLGGFFYFFNSKIKY